MKGDCLRPDSITRNIRKQIKQRQKRKKEYYDRRTTIEEMEYQEGQKRTN